MAKQVHGHPMFYRLCEEEAQLHAIKNQDYTKGGDPLGNFKRVSSDLEQWGIACPPYLVAFIYMMKQVDAVGNMFGQGYEGSVEGIEDRLRDISVYAKLATILYKETKCQKVR
jgi:hypothetical protein